MGGQKLGQVVLRFFEKYCQITPVDDALDKTLRFLHQPPEIWIHFESTSGDIHGADAGAGRQQFHGAASDVRRHNFRAFRAGVHVTMVASLIAEFAHIDLKRGRFCTHQFRHTILAQSMRESRGIPVPPGKNRKWRIRNSHQQHPLFRSPGKQQSVGASVVSE